MDNDPNKDTNKEENKNTTQTTTIAVIRLVDALKDGGEMAFFAVTQYLDAVDSTGEVYDFAKVQTHVLGLLQEDSDRNLLKERIYLIRLTDCLVHSARSKTFERFIDAKEYAEMLRAAYSQALAMFEELGEAEHLQMWQVRYLQYLQMLLVHRPSRCSVYGSIGKQIFELLLEFLETTADDDRSASRFALRDLIREVVVTQRLYAQERRMAEIPDELRRPSDRKLFLQALHGLNQV